jgi:hypothetical protein
MLPGTTDVLVTGADPTGLSLLFRWPPGAAASADHPSGAPALQVAADARLEETGLLRRTIGAGPTGSRSSSLC